MRTNVTRSRVQLLPRAADAEGRKPYEPDESPLRQNRGPIGETWRRSYSASAGFRPRAPVTSLRPPFPAKRFRGDRGPYGGVLPRAWGAAGRREAASAPSRSRGRSHLQSPRPRGLRVLQSHVTENLERADSASRLSAKSIAGHARKPSQDRKSV